MSRNIQFTAPYLDPPGPPVPLPEMPTELRERLKLEVQAYEAQFPFWKEKTQQAAALYVMILDFLWSDQTGLPSIFSHEQVMQMAEREYLDLYGPL